MNNIVFKYEHVVYRKTIQIFVDEHIIQRFEFLTATYCTAEFTTG